MISIPLLAISAYSGTGKTTLIKKLIPLLKQRNINVAVIKHSHHDVDIDKPGKDSYELRKAGATQTLLACNERWAIMTETPNNEVNLNYLASQLNKEITDLVLVEGFKHEPIKKIALYRASMKKPLSDLINTYTIAIAIAIASDEFIDTQLPMLDINNPLQIVSFIEDWLNNLSSG